MDSAFSHFEVSGQIATGTCGLLVSLDDPHLTSLAFLQHPLKEFFTSCSRKLLQPHHRLPAIVDLIIGTSIL
jgi:hypothetical protein